MALYLKASADFKLSLTSAQAQLLASRSFSLVESADLVEHTSQTVLLADGASDVAFNFGGVTTARALFILSDRQISFRFNGTEVVVLGHTAGEPAWIFMPATTMTSLSLDNASGEAATVHVVIAGV